MLDRGRRLDWFDSAEIVAYAAVASAAFWVFASHGLTSAQPFLDPLLLNRTSRSGC